MSLTQIIALSSLFSVSLATLQENTFRLKAWYM